MERLGTGFGNPNFVLSTEENTYSVWLEFPFTTYCRPDLFVLGGEHDSAFTPSVRNYLNSYDHSFYEKVLGQWKKGFLGKIFDIDSEIKSPEEKEIRGFLRGLSNYLKKGIIIESKEEPGEEEDAKAQVQRYKEIFQGQKIVLLTWFNWNKRVSADVVLDNFGLEKSSQGRITSLVN